MKNSSITASLSSIGFNISDVLKNDSTIEEAYAELKTEIATLNSSTYKSYVVYLDSSLLTRMNDLSTLYSNYVSGNESYTNITNARTLVRSSDTTQLSKTMISFWATKIDEIYNALSTQTDLGNESTTVLAIIGHIDDYKALNTQYLNQNYNVIHSKTVNIIKEYVYLRTNYESYLLSEFGISFSSSSN